MIAGQTKTGPKGPVFFFTNHPNRTVFVARKERSAFRGTLPDSALLHPGYAREAVWSTDKANNLTPMNADEA